MSQKIRRSRLISQQAIQTDEQIRLKDGGRHCAGKTCFVSRGAVRGGESGRHYPCLYKCQRCIETRRLAFTPAGHK
jgi:hypothetical protein